MKGRHRRSSQRHQQALQAPGSIFFDGDLVSLDLRHGDTKDRYASQLAGRVIRMAINAGDTRRPARRIWDAIWRRHVVNPHLEAVRSGLFDIRLEIAPTHADAPETPGQGQIRVQGFRDNQGRQQLALDVRPGWQTGPGDIEHAWAFPRDSHVGQSTWLDYGGDVANVDAVLAEDDRRIGAAAHEMFTSRFFGNLALSLSVTPGSRPVPAMHR